MRQGIRSELSDTDGIVVAEAANGATTITTAAKQRPNVVILTSELVDHPDTKIYATILEQHPTATIIFLSKHRNETSIHTALDANTRAYLLPDSNDLNLPHAIKRALTGE